jgi:hypothetical protein
MADKKKKTKTFREMLHETLTFKASNPPPGSVKPFDLGKVLREVLRVKLGGVPQAKKKVKKNAK